MLHSFLTLHHVVVFLQYMWYGQIWFFPCAGVPGITEAAEDDSEGVCVLSQAGKT